MIGCGIDIGSRTTKLVLYDADKQEMITSAITDSRLDKEESVVNLLDQALKKLNYTKKNIIKVITTGYGRELIPFADENITEITCHARGVYHLLPKTRTVIEIGGQDSKIIHLDATGRVRDFAMNDRCAAGTGRFLEAVARLLEIEINEMGPLAMESKKPANISSMCVVFAESEIIGLLSRKVSRSDIITGVNKAIATRFMGLAGRNLTEPITFTGGVALLPGMASALEEACGKGINIAPYPQFTGALGAAILAVEK
ncbi:MAG: acyl-CoA dehydratase activase [Planctomycetota bacterium]